MIMSWARQTSIKYDCTGKIPQLLLEFGSPVSYHDRKGIAMSNELTSHIFSEEGSKNSKIRSAQCTESRLLYNIQSIPS